MSQFYVAPENIRGSRFTLGAEESGHILRVRRIRPGETIRIFDGTGGVYRGVLEDGSGGIISERLRVDDYSFRIKLCFSLLARTGTEALLERCCAAGVQSFQPVISSRTQETCSDWNKRASRFRKIFVSACSQSMRARLPELLEPSGFGKVLSSGSASVICTFGGMKLPELSSRLRDARGINLFVGPEGGFTQEEISCAESAGAVPFSLGNYIMRAEDAAFAASSALFMGR